MFKVFKTGGLVTGADNQGKTAMEAANHLKKQRHGSRKPCKIVGACFFALTLFMFSSCATIFCGKRQNITVSGNVDTPVDLYVDGVLYRNRTLPAKIKIDRKNATSNITALAANSHIESG